MEPAGDVHPSSQLVQSLAPVSALYVLAGQLMHERSLWLLADWYFPLERPKKVSGDRLVDALEKARHERLAESNIHRSENPLPEYLGNGFHKTSGKLHDLLQDQRLMPLILTNPANQKQRD